MEAFCQNGSGNNIQANFLFAPLSKVHLYILVKVKSAQQCCMEILHTEFNQNRSVCIDNTKKISLYAQE